MRSTNPFLREPVMRLLVNRTIDARPNPPSQRFSGLRRLQFKIERASCCGHVSSPPVACALAKANLTGLPLRAHRVGGRGRTTRGSKMFGDLCASAHDGKRS
jgi:hypothetical protein